ncbi:hypothetical protein E4U55_004543, partial [Claviceps digitariae]
MSPKGTTHRIPASSGSLTEEVLHITHDLHAMMHVLTERFCHSASHLQFEAWDGENDFFAAEFNDGILVRTGLHMSASDPEPHVTLFVATEDMKALRQHHVMHSKANTEDIETAYYIGAKAYSVIHADDEQLRKSYRKPIHVRTSLLPGDDETKSFPVGYILDPSGLAKWFVLNKHGKPLYIESGFYTVGEGSSARMRFLHPELNKPVKAKFYGLERPQPVSPNPEPTNLEAGISHLNLQHNVLTDDFELVQLTVKLGKNMKKPLRCDTQQKPGIKTSWWDWEYLPDIHAFECEWYNSTLRCLRIPDGVEGETSSEKSKMQELETNPSGLFMQTDFLTPEAESQLLDIFARLEWPSLPGRRSLHYGYTFSYKTFGIDTDIPFKPFPDWLVPLFPPDETRPPDQVCLQHYPPGSGIPPHVDTHSAYDQLYSLSLGSPVLMQFRDGGGRSGSSGNDSSDASGTRVEVDLPPRSMLCMSGQSRLHWTHGIRARKTDTMLDGRVRPRGDRWSITFRWLRKAEGAGGEGEAACECGDERLCDTAQRRRGLRREYRWEKERQ